MNRKYKYVYLLVAFSVAWISLGLSETPVGNTLNNYLTDALYTNTSPEVGECIVIGIDEYALEQMGPWPWTRDVMADVIDVLNMDPECMPAAIGVDVIFTGTTDEYEDDRLAQSISESSNVVLACSANFDKKLVQNDKGMYIMDDFQIVSMNVPNEDFQAPIGHVNAMYDTDGILRHHLWSYEYQGETIYSFPYELYKLWCVNKGVEPTFEPPVDSRGFWYVDYSREPGDYFTYSIVDILDGNYDPELLKDAVVILGTYDASSMDYFMTSAERAERMYGVEYLANVTDAMISNISKESKDIEFIIFSFILLMGYTFYLYNRKISINIASYFIMDAATIGFCMFMYDFGYVLNPLMLLIGYLLAAVSSIIYHYVAESKKRQQITQIFSRYVDTDIIKQLLKEDSESLGLEGKECNIAIMFIDIRGFTSLSEKKTPMEVVKMLNKYLTLTSSCIKKHGGVVDKFIGDATMAFWGAPIPCEDSVYKACQAALSMVEQAKSIDTGGAAFGIGIHYGPAVVGNIGAEDRMDFTAIGDAVNTTERIESKAPKNTVYVSELVVNMLKGRIEATPLEEKLQLKGKTEPMQLYTLDGLL